jgi:putative prophage ps3 protein 01
MNERIDFCTHCRKETEYTLQKRNIVKTINGIEHAFSITVAICNECGEEMNPHGLIDKNIREVEEQYKANNTNKV